MIQEEVVVVVLFLDGLFATITSISQLTLKDRGGNILKNYWLDDSGFYHVSIDMNPYKIRPYSLTSSDHQD